jgi:hypothetical protein
MASSFQQHMEKMRSTFTPKDSPIGHWGSATRRNKIARATSYFGDHGRFRPLDQGMALQKVSGFPEPQFTTLSKHYLYAQRQIEKVSRTDWPTLYRGLGLPPAVLQTLGTGEDLQLTGCTAFAFDRATAEHYASSDWTREHSEAGSVPVILEIERDDVFDSSIAGWHEMHSRSGGPSSSLSGPAFEVVSGANAIRITEVIPGEDHSPILDNANYNYDFVVPIGNATQANPGTSWPIPAPLTSARTRIMDTIYVNQILSGHGKGADQVLASLRARVDKHNAEGTGWLEGMRRETAAKYGEDSSSDTDIEAFLIETMQEATGFDDDFLPSLTAQAKALVAEAREKASNPATMESEASTASEYLALGRVPFAELFDRPGDPRVLVRIPSDPPADDAMLPEWPSGEWYLMGGDLVSPGGNILMPASSAPPATDDDPGHITGRAGYKRGSIVPGHALAKLLRRGLPRNPVTVIRGRGVFDEEDE